MRVDFKKFKDKEISIVATLISCRKISENKYRLTWINVVNLKTLEYTLEFHNEYNKKLDKAVYKIIGNVYEYKRKNGTIDYSISIISVEKIE